MERIKSKASELRLLLNRVDSRKELINLVNASFDEAVNRLETRRSELLADIGRRSVAPDQHRQIIDIVSEVEQLADSTQSEPLDSAQAERLRLAEGRLDECLQREAELLQVGEFDAERATARLERLLARLRIDWHDEWALKRRADNPFSSAVTHDAADEEEFKSDEDGSGAAGCYTVPRQVDFGAYLDAPKFDKDCPAAPVATVEVPEAARQPAVNVWPARLAGTGLERGSSLPRRRGYRLGVTPGRGARRSGTASARGASVYSSQATVEHSNESSEIEDNTEPTGIAINYADTSSRPSTAPRRGFFRGGGRRFRARSALFTSSRAFGDHSNAATSQTDEEDTAAGNNDVETNRSSSPAAAYTGRVRRSRRRRRPAAET